MSRSRTSVALLAAASVAAGTLAAPLAASAADRPAGKPASSATSTDLASAIAKRVGVSRAQAARGLRAAGVDQRAAGGNADLSSLNGLLTFVTPLLGLPGEGSLQTLLDALGLHGIDANTLAALPTAITVPGGLQGVLGN